MYEFESLNGLKKLGYTIQLPNEEDKSYYFVKQFDKYTKRIYVKAGKATAKIEVIGGDNELTNQEEKLLQQLVFEDLNLREYKII